MSKSNPEKSYYRDLFKYKAHKLNNSKGGLFGALAMLAAVPLSTYGYAEYTQTDMPTLDVSSETTVKGDVNFESLKAEAADLDAMRQDVLKKRLAVAQAEVNGEPLEVLQQQSHRAYKSWNMRKYDFAVQFLTDKNISEVQAQEILNAMHEDNKFSYEKNSTFSLNNLNTDAYDECQSESEIREGFTSTSYKDAMAVQSCMVIYSSPEKFQDKRTNDMVTNSMIYGLGGFMGLAFLLLAAGAGAPSQRPRRENYKPKGPQKN